MIVRRIHIFIRPTVMPVFSPRSETTANYIIGIDKSKRNPFKRFASVCSFRNIFTAKKIAYKISYSYII